MLQMMQSTKLEPLKTILINNIIKINTPTKKSNMLSTPTLFNLVIITLHQKTALYWSPVPQLPYHLYPSLPWYCTAWRDSRRRCVCSAAAWRTLVLAKACWSCPVPTWRWDIGYLLNVRGLYMYGKDRWLASIFTAIANLISQSCGKVIFLGTRYCNTHGHKLSTKIPQNYILSKLLKIRTQTSSYWKIMLHSPSLRWNLKF